ncbi:MAG TPA: HAMP domain-containing sensor histidine kinase [Candidatus Dormibacteraeota bacterium]|nr:HAMP domain-containing sensor histidine kinase [Candidatus Dormibacteraeota bacterium]
MSNLLFGLTLAIEAAFAALALRTVLAWAREPDRRHGYLALGLLALALDIIISQELYAGGVAGQLATDAGVVLFLLSGYGLVMFRDSFVPLKVRTRNLIVALMVLAGVSAIATRLPGNPESVHDPFQTVVLVAIIGIWAYCIFDPIVTFWLAARGRPAVEMARLRAISIGYAGVLAVFVFGTVAGALSDPATIVLDLVALAIVPILYGAFFPPVWLRRIWRQPEEEQLRSALHDLLLYSPDRVTLAYKALGWAERLVGGESAFIIDAGGDVLASKGMSPADARLLAAQGKFVAKQDGRDPWRVGSSIVVPLELQQGSGAMVIRSERLTPIFGDEELTRLSQYATSLSAGLDRVTLSSKIAALERAKTDFLNIASHELRGPMTVIKGYLTMLEAGALGDVAPKVRSVLPLLISKSDEVNWMLEQMIEASRLEEGRLALKRNRADLVELTEGAIDGVRVTLSGHELKVDMPVESIEANVDPDRFKIVVRNLLSNAAKYSPSGSDISVRVRRDDDKAFVSVRDHGPGISKEDQVNLFTRFGRIETSTHVQGTGLGLWLSREIARMHDGDLTVDSKVGAGSTFTFMVPLTQ